MSSLDASLDTLKTRYGALPEQWAKDNLVSACSSCGQCFCPNHSPGILSDFQTEMKEQDEAFLDNMDSFPSIDSADIIILGGSSDGLLTAGSGSIAPGQRGGRPQHWYSLPRGPMVTRHL